ncbi:3,9-dihydroxypterocarpan 6A-monooxygenase, partial [Cucurbita argyrosperma subsp. argyrosperma]
MVLGKKYTDESENGIVSPDEFMEMMDELFLLSGVLSIGDLIPWIDFLDVQGYVKRMKAISKKFDRFLEHVLDQHDERRKGVEDYVAQDMVDVLLQLDEDPNLEVKLGRHGVKALTQKYTEESENGIVSPDEFKKMLDELFLLSGVLNIGDSIPWIDFLDLQGYVKRMKALSKKFDRFLEHVLDEHNERRKGVEGYVAKDMVDVLLQLADDPNLEVKLERHGVKAFTQDLIAGGTESSAVTVEWAMSELLKNPEIFGKAREELDRVIGRGRWVEERDMVNLPYINAIAKETMRLHPVAPMLVPR